MIPSGLVRVFTAWIISLTNLQCKPLGVVVIYGLAIGVAIAIPLLQDCTFRDHTSNSVHEVARRDSGTIEDGSHKPHNIEMDLFRRVDGCLIHAEMVC